MCQKRYRYIFAGNFTILCRPILKIILSAASVVSRSTGTVHTSAKARFATVAIRIRIRIRMYPWLDRHQNLIICLLSYCQSFLKISCKSVRNFFCANLRTDRQTNRQTTTKTSPTWRRQIFTKVIIRVLLHSLYLVKKYLCPKNCRVQELNEAAMRDAAT